MADIHDLQEQLAALRQRVAAINKRFEGPNARPVARPQPFLPSDEERKPAKYFIEEWMSGQEVETSLGRHFETERVWESHRRHGSMDISALAELPHDLLDSLSDGLIRQCCPTRWAFLDTETTGLAGGTGTYAFLIGVGRITKDGFLLRQFFMREHGEEPSMLQALAAHLAEFDVLVTYNGKAYDQPLLETRFRMVRSRPPFGRMDHLDLLFGARRLYRLRMENCRLVNLENQILGIERVGDLPGEMIPYVYFEYLRKKEAYRVAPIFHHNAVDILSLACLTGVVPWAFRSPETAPFTHGSDMVGVARWLRAAGKLEHAATLMSRAVERGLQDDLLWRTLWDLALLQRKLGQEADCLRAWQELSTCHNPHRVAALTELAKHHEHCTKDHPRALELTREALQYEDTPELRLRAARLEARLVRRKPKQRATPPMMRRAESA